MLSTALYFVVFGSAIGSRIEKIGDITYGAFIVPGLIMLSVLTQSIANASFGIYFPKFTGTIYELLSAPVSHLEIVISYVGAAATKSVLIGLIILATASVFVPLHIAHPVWMLLFLILTAVTFSLFGFIIGIWADGFEKLQLIPMLIVMPLTFLGGPFYSISMLPPVWQKLSMLNPSVYLISGFRWSFFDKSEMHVGISFAMTAVFFLVALSARHLDHAHRLAAQGLKAPTRPAPRRTPRGASTRGSLDVLDAARLHDDLDLHPLDRQRRERALVLDLVDVGAEPGEQRGDIGERAGRRARRRAAAPERPDLTMPRSMISASTSGSMLPPDRNEPDLVAGEARGAFITAARPTAPAPSTTVFSISSSIRIACSMSSSPTSTTSSTRLISGKVSAPGDLTPMPSAIVAGALAGAVVHRVPRRREALGLHADDADVGARSRAPRSPCPRSGRRRRWR